MLDNLDNLSLAGLVALLLLLFLIFLLIGWVVSSLWNYVMVYLFGVPTIDLGQALALYSLCRILFSTSNFSSSKN